MPTSTTDDKPLVFISYARRDGLAAAKHLDETLPQHGFRTWRDERGIDPAKDFTAEIERAIDASDYVVVVITPDTRRDDSFVRREIGYAQIVKKPVIVARFEDVPPPIQVVNNTWVDYIKRTWPEADRDLTAKLGLPPDQLHRTAPQHDPFRPYVEWLYQRMTRFLEQAVIRLIDLDVEADPDKVAPPPRRKETRDIFDQRYMPYTPQADPDPQSDAEPPHFDSFTEAYDYYNGRLLLLGDPGAGKSVTLMAFARDAAAARLDDPNAPLPVFGVIATWNAEEQTPLVEWLAASHDDLDEQQIARMFEGNSGLLLLDGLDELGGERQDRKSGEGFDPRQRFLAQLPADNRVIVSCRIEDYAEISERAPLKGAITLHPLSDAQIRAYLASDPDLLAAVEADDDLRALVRTPLIMSLFAFAYRDQTDTGELRDLSASPHALRKLIFERYVESRYRWEQQRSPDPLPFTLDEIYEVLGYVATKNRSWISNYLPFGRFVAAFEKYETQASTFVNFAERLHIIRADDDGIFRFTHALLLWHFARALFMLDRLRFDKSMMDFPAHERKDIYRERREDIKDVIDDIMQIGPRAVPDLIEALQDESSLVRNIAVDLLSRLGDVEVVPSLIDVLGTERGAAGALAQIGAPAVPALITALGSGTDAKAREHAAEVLGKLGDAQAVPALITALSSDTDAKVRSSAASALGQIGDAQAVPALITALSSDTDAKIRSSAASALGQIGDAQAVPALITALSNHTDASVRSSAAFALGKIGDAQAVLALIATLSDDEWIARDSAAGALGQIGDAQAVPVLINALNDSEWRVRKNAAISLGEIGDSRAVPALIDALNDSKRIVRQKTLSALKQIDDPRVVPALIKVLQYSDSLVRQDVAAVLGEIGDAQAVPALLIAYGNASYHVRTAVASALEKIGPQGIPALIAALKDSDSNIRFSAAVALAKTGDSSAVPALIAALDDENYYVRLYAADALGQIGDARAVPVLITALDDKKPDIRSRAARALGEIGDAQAVSALSTALDDKNWKIRSSAFRALKKIGTPEALEAVRQYHEREE